MVYFSQLTIDLLKSAYQGKNHWPRYALRGVRRRCDRRQWLQCLKRGKALKPAHIQCHKLVWNWLSWQTVSDNKIQISILILRRGALSSGPWWWWRRWWRRWWYWLMDSMRRSESDREVGASQGLLALFRKYEEEFFPCLQNFEWNNLLMSKLSHTISIILITDQSWREHQSCVQIFTTAISAELNT